MNQMSDPRPVRISIDDVDNIWTKGFVYGVLLGFLAMSIASYVMFESKTMLVIFTVYFICRFPLQWLLRWILKEEETK